jgi:hypothetical protein
MIKPAVYCLVLVTYAMTFSGISPQVFSPNIEILHPLKIEEENMKSLMTVGKAYIELLNQIGAAQNLSHESKVAGLCSTDCRKIVNGSVWYENSEEFLPQLIETKEKVGFWRIDPLDIIPGSDGKTILIRFLAHTEKEGVWNSMVILRCNDELLIEEINEVFNSYEGPPREIAVIEP